jgi:transposase
MSIKRKKEDTLYSVNHLMTDLLEEAHPLRIFSQEIYPIFNDGDFKHLYSRTGRSAVSPSFLSMVTILQYFDSLSDSEATEAVYLRLDWKYALHLPIEKVQTFDSSTLCNFRKRLRNKGEENIVFDKILKLCIEKGFIKKNANQRIDATHIIKHLNRLTTTELLFRSVRVLLEKLEKNNPNWFNNTIPEDLRERYSKKFSSFGLSKEKRSDKQAEIVEDGYRLAALLEKEAIKDDETSKQVSIMNTVFDESVKIRKKEVGEKVFIEVDEIERPKQSVIDPRDTTIQLGRKGKTSWNGEKCHVVETSNPGEVNFIVDMIPQSCRENDNKILPELEKRNNEAGLSPEKTYADSNYISSGAIKDFERKNKVLMGYVQEQYSNIPEEFRIDKFKIDIPNQTAECPEGKTCDSWAYNAKEDNYRASFYKKTCSGCLKNEKCIGIDNKKKGRIITIVKEYEALCKRRIDQKTDEFKKEMKVRAQIEATISALVRFHGLRMIKYKGPSGRAQQYYMAACAFNIKRYVKKVVLGMK